MPKVSIVLPTFNGAKYLAEALESIISQTFTDWELIVVNDCSTDNTFEILKEFASKENRIRVIENKINLKLPASLNEGFKHASGVYYTWTSDDNRYKINALDEMVNVLDRNTDAGLVYCNMDIINASGEFINTKLMPDIPRDLINHNIIGACFMYRADIAKKVGNYEPDFFLAEDYEYWLRFFFNSKLYKSNLTLYEYRTHDKSLTATKEQQIRIQRARVKYYHLTELICKISDLAALHGLYCELVTNKIVLTEKEISLFKSKDKNIKKWFRAFVFCKNHQRIKGVFCKDFNFELPDGVMEFIRLPESYSTKVASVLKKVLKFILPYGVVRYIQKTKRF